jgi:hypothetical protein
MTFNTKALSQLAVLTATMGVDMWRYGLRHGFSLKDAWDFALPHVMTRVHYWPWKQSSGDFTFDRFGEIFGDVYRAYTPTNSSQGPYSYTLLNRDFWTSKDFLARFKGNFWRAVRVPAWRHIFCSFVAGICFHVIHFKNGMNC